MSYYVGIVRSDVRLKRAMDRLHLLYTETEELYNTSTLSPQLCELRNLITNGYLVTRSAGMSKERAGDCIIPQIIRQTSFSGRYTVVLRIIKWWPVVHYCTERNFRILRIDLHSSRPSIQMTCVSAISTEFFGASGSWPRCWSRPEQPAISS